MLPTISGVFNAVDAAQTGTYQDGTKWAILNAAANRSKKNDDGQWETVATLFVSITGTGYLAERLARFGKGDPLFASGEIQTEQREHQGNRYTNVRLRAKEVRAVERENQNQQQGGGYSSGGSGYSGGGYSSGGSGFGSGADVWGGQDQQGFGGDEPPF